MRNVALDLGGSKISYCEVKAKQVVARATVTNLSALVEWIGPNAPKARVAFEACREAWFVHDQVLSWGHEPLMIDTTRVRQMGVGQHRRKNDRIDAEMMARALDEGRVPLAHVLSPARRELRFQLGVRRTLVETRAQYVTMIRGLARAHGKAVPSCRTVNFAAKLAETPLDESMRALVAPMQTMLEPLNPQIELVTAKLEQPCAAEPAVARLATAPGVGLLVAATFVSVLDEAKRFRRAHEVEAYVGLVPSENTSIKRRLGSITKQGNSYARAMLVEAAQSIFRLRADDPLKRWGEAIEKRRGKSVAVIAVARRLAGVLWAMWRDGTTYCPARLAVPSARGLSSQAAELAAEADAVRATVQPNRRRPSKRSPAQKTPREVRMA